ncbi:MAG: hypothetical protein ABJM86_11070 [Hyphomicrobiales bacterium]
MKKYLLALAVASLPFHAPVTVMADDGASQAKSWKLTGEEKARFSAKVVDVLCEVAGKCADNCGAGSYQIGLLTTDGKLIPINKNGQGSFNGGVDDLLPFCGKNVEVDGLLVGENVPSKYYQVQLIKPEGGEWAKANLHTKKWKEKYPDAGGKGPWFRRDPRVLSQLEKDGYLGLGADADKAFIKENY